MTDFQGKPPRTGGLRIRGHHGHRGHPEVKGAMIRFARWLRREYDFPIRVPVYLSPREQLITMHGTTAAATFFAPWDPDVEPYIRIATGDFDEELEGSDRDEELGSFLLCLAHEVVHYQQWIATGRTTERGVNVRARNMVDRYALTVDHP
ncbi:MAG: hypothetical protein AAF907_11340 [Planctomycetota bacterium]